MREIKFSYYDEGLKEMVYFDLKDLTGSELDYQIVCEMVESGKIRQYTGLKDKNGKEIYESDIVKAKSVFGTKMKRVGYLDTHAGFFVGDMDVFQLNMESMSSLQAIEVIGNIYENPELLK
jgi:uncharacterized phage protein (TIGR01671 family)